MVRKLFLIVLALCAYGILLHTDVILAATASTEPMCTTAVCLVMGKFPDINAWLIAIFTFLGLLLRASADLLGFVSKTLAKSDSGWGQRLSDWALFCSSVVGWFGGGVPKAVLENKIEQAKDSASSRIEVAVDAPK